MINVPDTAKIIKDKNGCQAYLQGVERNELNQFMATIVYTDNGERLYLPYNRIEKYL